jgi:hypothetical protein
VNEPSTLPVLYSMRCWPEDVNPEYIRFIDEMRSTGVEVVDICVPPTGFKDLGEWAGAFIEEVMTRHDPADPLHLVAYCAGGEITLPALHQLEAAGIFPAFVGFIDVRQDREQYCLERGIDSLYLVPWQVRFRRALIRLTPPDRESLGAVLGSLARRAVRSVKEFPQRGWRSRKRRNPEVFEVFCLSYPWEFDRVITPLHLYNTKDSIGRYAANDPSLHIGRNLSGGFVIRFIEGTHEKCIEPPFSAALIERITADRVKASRIASD